MMVDQNSFIRERPFFANNLFSGIFRELHAYISRNPCCAHLLLWRFTHDLLDNTKLSRITSS